MFDTLVDVGVAFLHAIANQPDSQPAIQLASQHVPPSISDEGVVFSAAPYGNAVEGVAFSAEFQAMGLHFQPLALGWGVFFTKPFHFRAPYPFANQYVEMCTCPLAGEKISKLTFLPVSYTHLTLPTKRIV